MGNGGRGGAGDADNSSSDGNGGRGGGDLDAKIYQIIIQYQNKISIQRTTTTILIE
jgi:hypothetical protein